MTKKAPKSVLEAAKVFAERALGERGTQTGLAKRWGVSQPAVSEVLAGNGIGISVLVAMCSAEGFSADEVLGLRAPSSSSGDGSAPDRPARRLRACHVVATSAAERARASVVVALRRRHRARLGGEVVAACIERRRLRRSRGPRLRA